MSPRTRAMSFGAAVALLIAGAIVGAVSGGVAGEAVAISLLSLGAIAVVSLVFLEVGLSEDRDRAREHEQERQPRAAPARLPRPPRRRRPG